MNTKYQRSLERSLETSKARSEHYFATAQKQRENLIQDFSIEGGPSWSSSSNVFAHVENEARGKAHADLARVYTSLLENASYTHEAAMADLKSAIDAAKERLKMEQDVLVEALKAGRVPAGQTSWITHRARIEVLTEAFNVALHNSPSEFE